MLQKKPVKKVDLVRGCETCDYREGDFTKDSVDENIIRIYCKARHFSVDAEAMSKDCDFWRLNPAHRVQPEEDNKYGL